MGIPVEWNILKALQMDCPIPISDNHPKTTLSAASEAETQTN